MSDESALPRIDEHPLFHGELKMSSALWTVTLALALGQTPIGPDPYGGGPPPSEGGIIGGVGDEQLYPFDGYDAWLHGQFQEIPAYGGFRFFRPYNYKHVLAQSQVAGGWGMSPTMPYSQEYFRKYREQAAVQQRLSNLDAIYATELARLRAQRDFQRTLTDNRQQAADGDLRQAAAAPVAQRGIDPAGYASPGYAPPGYVHPATVPPGYVPPGYIPARPSRIDELQERIRQQTLQLQALQGSLQEELDNAAQPVQNPVYRAPAPMR